MAFEDRIVEFPGRIILTNANTGVVLGTFDVTRAEGEVTNPGTVLNAENLTAETNELIDNKLDGAGIGGVKNKKIIGGTTAITTKNGTASVDVSFADTFGSIPVVVITQVSAAKAAPGVKYAIAAKTASGFTLKFTHTAKASLNVDWLAIGEA